MTPYGPTYEKLPHPEAQAMSVLWMVVPADAQPPAGVGQEALKVQGQVKGT